VFVNCLFLILWFNTTECTLLTTNDYRKENVSMFKFGGANANREFNLFRQPSLRIKDAQDTFSQNCKTLCC